MRHELHDWDTLVGAAPITSAVGERVPLSSEERRLCLRVRGEFLEMPGLTLTVPQAARLFNLDRTQCLRILQSLVDSGHLVNDGRTSQFRCASPYCS